MTREARPRRLNLHHPSMNFPFSIFDGVFMRVPTTKRFK
jgi:hypothetical protein